MALFSEEIFEFLRKCEQQRFLHYLQIITQKFSAFISVLMTVEMKDLPTFLEKALFVLRFLFLSLATLNINFVDTSTAAFVNNKSHFLLEKQRVCRFRNVSPFMTSWSIAFEYRAFV